MSYLVVQPAHLHIAVLKERLAPNLDAVPLEVLGQSLVGQRGLLLLDQLAEDVDLPRMDHMGPTGGVVGMRVAWGPRVVW